MWTAADGTTGGGEHGKNHADQEQGNSENPQNMDSEDKPQDEKDEANKNH